MARTLTVAAARTGSVRTISTGISLADTHEALIALREKRTTD